MSGLFGSAAQNNQNPSNGGGGLFGASTNQTSGNGLFGSSTNQTSGGGLFGSNTNTNTSGGGGLFGSSTTANTNTGGGGLFGSSTNTNTNTNTGGGLFGNNPQQSSGGGLFGSNSNQTVGSSSIFGGQNNNTNVSSNNASVFGNPATTTATSSIFGAQSGQVQNTNDATSSLFGGNLGTNTQTNQNSGFGSSVQNAQLQNRQQSTSSLFGPSTSSVGNASQQISASQLQRLQFSGYSTAPNEKRVADQIKTVMSKWDPNHENNILKTYLYNAVDKAYAPFFYPDLANGEDEKSWEEALSRKPELPKVEGANSSGMAYIPTLCRGFKALGDRVETQAKVVQEMRTRLHEMNNSLTAVMDAHQQRITVKVTAARRQHQALAQRCLRLAVKVQVLCNRGYALDAAEEGLRKTLINLEKQVMNAEFVGREDEIWARMVALRERARWLDEEGKRVSAQLNDQDRQRQNGANGNAGSGVSEEVLLKTRKILKDYDDQLGYLNGELEDVKKEYAGWEQTQRR